jgi:vacuolar-type H+-ATPase subunit F/Vma7
MKARIVVLGDAPLVMGFRLAGIEDTINCTEDNYQDELEKAIKDGKYGIIITNVEQGRLEIEEEARQHCISCRCPIAGQIRKKH